MQFSETVIPGVWIIDTIKNGDSRGYFSRAWCKQEFNKHGVTGELSQANLSFSKIRYTLRGLHYQKGSDAEMKAVRCMKGSIFDVAVDLRSESTTFMKWTGIELNESNGKMLVVPEGCAHGFLTLSSDTVAYYLVSKPYAPDSEGGIRWDDPSLDIKWPSAPMEISEKDQNWPLLKNITGHTKT